MKFEFNLQLFAHKKGVGSTRNGRDSENRKELLSRQEIFLYVNAERIFIQVTTLESAAMTLYLQRSLVESNSNAKINIVVKSASIQSKQKLDSKNFSILDEKFTEDLFLFLDHLRKLF